MDKKYKVITDLKELNDVGRAEEISLQHENKLMRQIVSQIKKTMKKNNLTSLSAPGIGYNKRIFCIDYSDNEIKTYINPVISYADGLEISVETCSSIPGKEYIIPRNKIIDLIYETPTGKIKTNRFKGIASFVIQHEIHHLEGVTLEDIGLEIEEDFKQATEEEQNEIINEYLDSLDIKKQNLDDEIEGNPELKTISDRLKFTEALARGDIKLEDPIKDDKE